MIVRKERFYKKNMLFLSVINIADLGVLIMDLCFLSKLDPKYQSVGTLGYRHNRTVDGSTVLLVNEVIVIGKTRNINVEGYIKTILFYFF